ncbi:MAG: carboxymethylenebutenolidase [Acidimicrobiaceae bacterium]|nr:carboxymethylenebutenolidase [Acidimicrobiaceae bacterium]
MAVETQDTTVGALRAFVAKPETDGPGPGPGPGVLVLHELFGLNDDMRRIARRFADNGYVAMAPDLFSHGNKAVCLARVLADVARGGQGRTLDDVVSARNALGEMDGVDPARVGVAGFCMGGNFALLLGATGTVQASAVNYGAVPKRRDDLRAVCPVVASYGAGDRVFAGQARRLEEHLTALGVPHDVKVYEGVGHSFLNWENAPAWMLKLPSPMHPGYSEPAAEDAWARMLGFFSQYV